MYLLLSLSDLLLDISLQSFLNRSECYSQCEQWRSREQKDGIYSDVYDGNIWKNFNGSPFLSEPGNYAVMMNLDFFQPYKHVQYSLGAIYFTILNLPRVFEASKKIQF